MAVQETISSVKSKSASRASGVRMILLLSLLSIEVAVLGGKLFNSWETGSADLLMSWRYKLTPAPKTLVSPEIAVLAIDTDTLNKLGPIHAGKWLTREVYSDQLAFFDKYIRPTALAYDIVFQDVTGESIRKQRRVSSSPELLSRMIGGLNKIVADPRDSLDDQILYDMNSLALEQGTMNMAHSLAAIAENDRFRPVLGYYFRSRIKTATGEKVNQWSDEAVFGSDKNGDETKGAAIPYLRDVSIPLADIHFQPNQKYDYQCNAELPSPELLDYSMLGFLNAAPDEDGIMRWAPLVVGFTYSNSVTRAERKAFVPSLALISCFQHLGLKIPLSPGAVEVFLGNEIVIHSPRRGDIRIPIDERGRMYLNFTARFADFTDVSYAGVAPSISRTSKEDKLERARFFREFLNDRIVLCGVSSAGIDIGPCPIDPRSPLMIVHMTAANNILKHEFIMPLRPTGKIVMWACLFVIFSTVCCSVATSRLGVVTLLCVIFYISVAFACVYRSWVILPVIGPLMYIGTCSLAVLSYRFLAEERAKRRIREMFSTMVSDQVLNFLEENPDSFSLRGHNVEATVFFSDIVGFTGISERLPSERLTDLLNQYLTPATDLILNHGGYVDKYMGDGIMAVWGAPYPDPEHAVKACLSALRQQEMLADLNRRLESEFGVTISVRMGLNSGTVKAGNMGSARKFQYTVIGDAVNLASRLEPANTDFGTSIIAGESTSRIVDGRIVCRPLGKLVVVGKEEVLSIFEIVGESGRVDSRKLEILALYESALASFYNRAWSDCIASTVAILNIGSDGPAIHLQRRAEFYQKNPPDADWQGEYVRLSKS